MIEMNEESNEVYNMSDYKDPSGWAMLAGVMMWGISVFSFTALCAGFFNRSLIMNYSVFGMKWDFIWYGIFDGLVSLVSFLTGIAIWQYRKVGFWLGIIFATLSAGRWMLFIEGAPIWSLTMVFVWILVIYGLIRDKKFFS